VVADRPPFEDLYRAYLGRIYAYVRAQVTSSADAEDITAQVFMNAYQAYARFEARNTTPSAWLFRIARNATLDHFRAHGRRERLRRTIEHQPVPEEDPSGLAEERIQYRALLGRVAQLPERQREAIALRHSGLSFEEVGGLLKCSEDAAKMLYHRAVKALKEAVQQEVAEGEAQ
jgi:RNA polymerase sigma-70 factor, ECF subfamily